MNNDKTCTPEGKQCPRCSETKPLESFAMLNRAGDGRQTWCRRCANEYGKQRSVERAAELVPDLPREEWRPVPAYEELYAASNLGRVKRLVGANAWDEKLLQPITRVNRLVINLWRDGKSRQRPVHRIIYETWRGPIPEGWDVHHLTGDWTVNTVWSLAAMPKRIHLFWHRQGLHEKAVKWMEGCTAAGHNPANLRCELKLFPEVSGYSDGEPC